MTDIQECLPRETQGMEQVADLGNLTELRENAASAEANGYILEDEPPTIDIIINNVVCSFNTRCHLNLRNIAMEGSHVEYRREQSMCNMKIRRPYTTATIWSSGKIVCTGATSEEESKIAARKFARKLQRLGYTVKFTNFRVVNVLGTCGMPFRIKINSFSQKFPKEASYEPELHPGVTYRLKEPKATLKIFSTGSITVTAPSVANVQAAIEHIFPLVSEFKAADKDTDKDIVAQEIKFMQKQRGSLQPKQPVSKYEDYEKVEVYDTDYSDDEEFDSDESQD
ncbi:TATA box-binding protein-like 1 [Ostrea edulis]|uniref:TATA box-binding protein-like 1 n=1 Tax=Ostrea edulis TaxID=37623 RepID=UPI002094AFCE|nr:TATA box-binding protein-like 1 [Ostrea edulis]